MDLPPVFFLVGIGRSGLRVSELGPSLELPVVPRVCNLISANRPVVPPPLARCRPDWSCILLAENDELGLNGNSTISTGRRYNTPLLIE